ncbi:MAG: type VI secretion system tip protein VgrG [Luteitalea sp.]|nr:type VI secretion system tip protein VgrG [Luteitalea sp.]
MPRVMEMRRVMDITTPLGDDVLLFHGMHAREEMSRLFEYQLDLLSTRGDIDLDEILGKNVTVNVALPDNSTRAFNGHVTRFAQSGMSGRYHRYLAVVRPWLWFLTRTTDCRIFQDMTVPDIVKAVFNDHTTADFTFELTSTYRTWSYCVQYRETDFNFVSRLLEHEGIYYYFRHTDGRNTMVLTDSTAKHTTSPGYEELPFIAPEQMVRPDIEHVSSWDFSREIQPGVYVHDDYDFERPSVALRTRKALPRNYAPSNYEVYDYPGHYAQRSNGEHYAEVRIDEYGSQFETANASTNARGVHVGSLFTLDRHPRADQNREHLILAASYDLQFSEYEALSDAEGSSYRCNFVAMSSQQQFRPKRRTPKPFMQGPQTAVVVGPEGEEISTDRYGRVKVQFHWDREGRRDQGSSCWVRVSTLWAGKGWGAIHIPRIGQEVIVDFLEGDPDRPIVTGRVYNAEFMPPYTLPDNKTQSGIKSRSTPDGTTETFNELRFEDKKGAEEVYLHAERNLRVDVERNDVCTIGRHAISEVKGTRAVVIKSAHAVDASDLPSEIDYPEGSWIEGDYLEVEGDRRVYVGKAEVHEVKDDHTLQVTEGHHWVEVFKGDQTIDIREGDQKVDIQQGDQTLEIGLGNQTIDITLGNQKVTLGQGNQEITLKVGNRTVKLDGGNQETKASLGKITEEAMVGIEMKVGQNSVKIDHTGVTIKGMMLRLEGQISTQIKGTMTNIDGTAMLTAKGGLISIG